MNTVKKNHRTMKDSFLIPKKYQHAAAIIVIFLSLVFFFNEVVFQGKVFVSGDTMSSHSFETLYKDSKAQGIFPLWNPYIFCGMPGYASLTLSGERLFDFSAYILGLCSTLFAIIVMNRAIGWELFYYFVFGVGMYLFMFEKLKDKIAALIVSLATVHSTFIAILVMVGHMTKVPVLAFFPFVFLFVERLRDRFSWRDSLLLILTLHFLFLPGHMQMILYVYLSLGLYFLFFIIRNLFKKENVIGLLRSGIILTCASGFAFAMTGDQYLSTLEYAPYSMRGADPIAKIQEKLDKGISSTQQGGLDYDYATQWSFSPGETFTFIVPSLYGFGWQTYQGPLTRGAEQRLNTYFGQQPFTDAPQYMGITIIVLAVIGLIRNRRNPFVQYAALAIVLALLISYGRQFSLFYDLMFNYFPMFNKFRIPSMILIIVQMFVPVLAGFGIASLFELQQQKLSVQQLNRWKAAVLALAGLFVLALVGRGITESVYSIFFSQEEVGKGLANSYGALQPEVIKEFYSFIAAGVSADVTAAFFVMLLVFGIFYLYFIRKVSAAVVTVTIIAAVLFDLWRVNFKPMEMHTPQAAKQSFATPDYVQFVQQRDTSLFRTLEFVNGQPPYSNMLAYWRVQSAYGYQGAKMRAYQDMVDVVGLGNPLLWGLMNVKYIFSDRMDSSGVMTPIFQGRERIVFQNRYELPRAFFVNRYQVASGMEILNNIKSMSFNPADVAFMMEDPKIKIDPAGAENSAKVTHYGIQDLEVNATATGNNLLFLSEAYYPQGWKAFIDGNETPIYRLNYHFRGVVVPQGNHTMTMKFEPKGFELGKTLSLLLNIGVLGGLAFVFGLPFVRKKKELEKKTDTAAVGAESGKE